MIASPPLTNKYAILKQRVLDKFAESSDSKLKRLLRGGETVGKKPSDILDHMRRLAPATGCEAVIRSLFLAELPNSIRPLISEVTSALRALTTKVDKLQGELRQSKHAQLSRHPHDSSNDVGSKLCFYHTRFGENARKCQPACPRYQSSN
ncbi:hypothetical protein KR215_004423 [Drosophila sulfurigaster]|nr:hypothetical protein KR215_004423 [Drosophila sulfurigaster]